MSVPRDALRREERVILAWIRHVTAEKQARLRAIRRELEGCISGNTAETT